MNVDFVNAVSDALKIKRRDLVEKDFVLHMMLSNLSKDKYFYNNFLLKGGTCLIKCHLGYFRFSEDIDFTWKDQGKFRKISQKAIRREISGIIDRIGEIFEDIAEKHGMDFKCRKDDRNYVELVGGDKSATFKIWYESGILNRRTFLKIQINFVDLLLFKPEEKHLASIIDKKEASQDLKVLFAEDFRAYSTKPRLMVYDIREIFCEKVRSILTRRGIKARDFLDVYLISTRYGLKFDELEDDILAKIRFILGMYERYRNNFEGKKKLIESGKVFEWGQEKDLVISEIDEMDFYKFLNVCKGALLRISNRVSG